MGLRSAYKECTKAPDRRGLESMALKVGGLIGLQTSMLGDGHARADRR